MLYLLKPDTVSNRGVIGYKNAFILDKDTGFITYLTKAELDKCLNTKSSAIKRANFTPSRYKDFISKVLISGLYSIILYEDEFILLRAQLYDDVIDDNTRSCFVLQLICKEPIIEIGLPNKNSDWDACFYWDMNFYKNYGRYKNSSVMSLYQGIDAVLPYELAKFLWESKQVDVKKELINKILKCTYFHIKDVGIVFGYDEALKELKKKGKV